MSRKKLFPALEVGFLSFAALAAFASQSFAVAPYPSQPALEMAKGVTVISSTPEAGGKLQLTLKYDLPCGATYVDAIAKTREDAVLVGVVVQTGSGGFCIMGRSEETTVTIEDPSTTVPYQYIQ